MASVFILESDSVDKSKLEKLYFKEGEEREKRVKRSVGEEKGEIFERRRDLRCF